MIKTILIIIISVSIFGLILFVLVKNAMKKKESVKVILPKKELVVEEIRRSYLSEY